MTTKQMEQSFKKILHRDIQPYVDMSIENYNADRDYGHAIIMDDFEPVFEPTGALFKSLKWYLNDPKKNYKTALHSDYVFDRVIAILDQQTGVRCIDDWEDDENDFIQAAYQLRKKYQK